ncbi:hypothetical protein KIS4809_2327 [Bacillus sp. ZZV12-4809]|nr:hypothetical protein KIS4809_2327 [Bacillus sp. ZZV12-4809]
MKKVKFQSLFITSIFLLTIFGLGAFHVLTPDEKQSILENRKLEQRPDLSLDKFLSGDYSKRFENYFNDQFPERGFFIEANAMLNRNILRQDVNDDVYIADDGYLLSAVAEQDSKEAKVVAERINNFSKLMGERNVNVYTALMPNKSTMMQNKFPNYFPSFGQENMDLLYKELDDITNPIDSRDILNKHMNEENMFFYTDHHWQAKAAFYAYQNVMSYIVEHEDLDEEVLDYKSYKWDSMGKPFYGSDARKTTSANAEKSDKIVVATLKDSDQKFEMKWGDRKQEGLYFMDFLKRDDLYTNRYQAYLGGDYALLTIDNLRGSNKENVLVIKDSYANAFIQFLAPHYKETHVMDLRHYKGIPIEEYVDNHNIDHIILLNNVNSIYVTPSLTNFENPGQGENQ